MANLKLNQLFFADDEAVFSVNSACWQLVLDVVVVVLQGNRKRDLHSPIPNTYLFTKCENFRSEAGQDQPSRLLSVVLSVL